MPGLRLLLRFAPFLVGLLAAVVWLRRRQAARIGRITYRPPVPAALPAAPVAPPVAEAVRAPSRRFERVPAREPIDIVTVVDDLLAVGR